MQLTHVAREGRPGELTELASEMRLIGVTMLRRKSRPGRLHRGVDRADHTLEARQSTERLGPETSVVAKRPLELPRAKAGERHERIHPEWSIRQSQRAHGRQQAMVGEVPRPREPRA